VTEVVEVMTGLGPARWHVDPPSKRSVAQLLLGHGAGGGVDAADLTAIATALPPSGIEVCRFEQPWRVAGRKVAGTPSSLDRAWLEGLGAVAHPERPVVVGGRSAGARVACRTAKAVGAVGVLTLAFPLHPPGRPENTRADELPDLPLLAVQGGRDPFGSADEVRQHSASEREVLEIPGGDHSLRVSRSGPVTQSEADEIVLLGVRRWMLDLVRRYR
jgi:predicted alpha/beta-hydrolase family hydrolase